MDDLNDPHSKTFLPPLLRVSTSRADTRLISSEIFRNRPSWSACGIGLLGIAIASFLQQKLFAADPSSPLLLFYPAILLAAWVGGKYCGMVATFLSAALMEYSFRPPYYHLKALAPADYLSEGLFIAMGIGITVLIDRQKKAHAVAATASARLRNLVDWLDHAIVIELDATTYSCSFVSKGTERLLQVPMEDWYRQPGLFLKLVHPADHGKVIEVFKNASEVHNDQSIDHRLIHPSGKICWYQTGVHADREGTTTKLRCITVDIERLKQSEQRESSQKRMYDTLLDSMDDHIYRFDANKRYTYVNRAAQNAAHAALKFWKRHPFSQMIGKTMRELGYADEFLDPYEANLDMALLGKTVRQEVLFPTPTGQRNYEYVLSPVYNQIGKIEGVVGITREVTEQVKAQKAIRESAEQFRELAESMPQIVWAADPAGKAYYYNGQWFEFLGKTKYHNNIFRDQELVHPEDQVRVANRWEWSISNKKPFDDELRVKGKSGRFHWFLARALPIFNSDKKLARWYGTLTNIDENKKAQEAVARSLKTREEMLAIVSHDLRNPLGSILMNASMLRRKPNFGEAFNISQANKIQRAAERMNEMIEDLLNLAKMEAGNFTLSQKDGCGREIIAEAVEGMTPLADEKKILIEVINSSQADQLSCDHSQLLRVFSNLLGNAIKFTPEHGRVQIETSDLGNEIQFCISDTGPGIAEHHIPHIFDRFWQAAKTQQMGTGLGLAIAKGIVEAHGGRIWVKSRFGHGASFCFTIPKMGAKSNQSVA